MTSLWSHSKPPWAGMAVQESGITFPSPICPPKAAVSLYLGVPNEWLSSVSSVSPSSKGEITLQRKTMLPGQLINHLSLLWKAVSVLLHTTASSPSGLPVSGRWWWFSLLSAPSVLVIPCPSWGGQLVLKPSRRWKTQCLSALSKRFAFLVAELARAMLLQAELSGLC